MLSELNPMLSGCLRSVCVCAAMEQEQRVDDDVAVVDDPHHEGHSSTDVACDDRTTDDCSSRDGDGY